MQREEIQKNQVGAKHSPSPSSVPEASEVMRPESDTDEKRSKEQLKPGKRKESMSTEETCTYSNEAN